MFGDWFNLAGGFKDAAMALWDNVQTALAMSIDFNGLQVVQYLLGNTLTLSLQASIYVLFFTLLAALVIRRMRVNGAISLVQALTLPVTIVLIFIGADQLQSIGDTLKKLANGIGAIPADQLVINQLAPPVPVDLIPQVAALMFAGLLVWGYQLLTVTIGYEFLSVLLTMLGVFLWAVYGLGERTRRLFSFTLATFLVTGVIGVPVIILFTQLAQIVSNVWFGGDDNLTFTTVLILFAASMGVLAQFVLVWLMFKAVDRVYGKIKSSVDKITQPVRSILENKQRLNAHLAGRPRTTVTHKFSQMSVNLANLGLARLETRMQSGTAMAARAMHNHRHELLKKTQEARTNRALSAAGKAITGASVVAPHPLVKAGTVVAGAALTKLSQTGLPRISSRRVRRPDGE